MSAPGFSHVLRADRIPPRGKHVRLDPGEEERRAIAEALGIVGVETLAVDLDVRPVGVDAIGVRGSLEASVVQTDVVTLEPVGQSVAEEIDVTLVPAGGGPSDSGETSDERDVYRNGQIDLGEIVVEHLALGLDPYPRAPGVEFPGHVEDDSAKPSPFAALARLKRDPK